MLGAEKSIEVTSRSSQVLVDDPADHVIPHDCVLRVGVEYLAARVPVGTSLSKGSVRAMAVERGTTWARLGKHSPCGTARQRLARCPAGCNERRHLMTSEA